MLKQLVSSPALVAAVLSSSPAFATDDARSAIFNGVSLGLTPKEVVTDAASTPGTQADLYIRQASVIGAGQEGLYTADITMVFDAVPRITL